MNHIMIKYVVLFTISVITANYLFGFLHVIQILLMILGNLFNIYFSLYMYLITNVCKKYIFSSKLKHYLNTKHKIKFEKHCERATKKKGISYK